MLQNIMLSLCLPDNLLHLIILLFLPGNLGSDQVCVDHLALLDRGAVPGAGDRG